MADENSNPETGEFASDEAAVAAMVAAREAVHQSAEADEDNQEEEPATEGSDGEEASDETEGAEAEEEAQDEEPLYTVKIDGVERQVNLAELQNGYQREADYRRKTQSLAEERRAVEVERGRQSEITAALIAQLQQAAGSNTEQEPDWVKLSQEDPIGAIQLRAQWDARRTAQERARQNAAALANQQRTQIATMEAEKLRAAVSEWANPETFKADYADIVQHATSEYGFDAAEVAQVLDHRTLLVLRDAVRYRKLQSAKPVVEKKVAAAPKVVAKPGSPAGKAELRAKDLDAARQRLRSTGSDDDAVALLRAKRR